MPRDIVTIRRRGGYFTAVAAGFVPCAGTAGFHSAFPNDLTQASAWSTPEITPTFGSPDPIFGSTSTSLVCNNAGAGAFTVQALNAFPFTLTGGVTYSFGAYLKWIAGPVWMLIQVSDNTANAVGAWFDISTSQVGTTTVAGAGNTLQCARIQAAANGFSQLSFAVNLQSTNSAMALTMIMVNGDGGSAPTLNQQFLAWQVCP